eukprot:8711033-Pyramimonas_sp.AAC.1
MSMEIPNRSTETPRKEQNAANSTFEHHLSAETPQHIPVSKRRKAQLRAPKRHRTHWNTHI